eukprot:m.198606 g.198606  ORF g.198606 m.198606 type:complete len:83 (-) comp16836_c0_seq14:1299-1547(-)
MALLKAGPSTIPPTDTIMTWCLTTLETVLLFSSDIFMIITTTTLFGAGIHGPMNWTHNTGSCSTTVLANQHQKHVMDIRLFC